MDEAQKQILKNQSTILLSILDISENNKLDMHTIVSVKNRMEEIMEILHPESEKESKALHDERDVKMGNICKCGHHIDSHNPEEDYCMVDGCGCRKFLFGEELV